MVLVIYHYNCCDGIAAAYLLIRFHIGSKKVKLHPAKYGTDPPDVTGEDVYLVDFSYPLDKINQMIKLAKSFLIIDHHVTAEKDLADLADEYKHISTKHSATMLVWNKYVGTEPAKWVKWIDDYDLWSKKYPETDPFHWGLDLHLRKDEDYAIAQMDSVEENATRILGLGRILYKNIQSEINRAVKNVSFHCFIRNHEMILVGYLNSSSAYRNEISEAILNKYPCLDFTVIYAINSRNQIAASLRSNGFDLTPIAKEHDGGGHKTAAGCLLKEIYLSYPHMDNVVLTKIISGEYNPKDSSHISCYTMFASKLDKMFKHC